MNACPHCGTENTDGAEFCSQCGTRLGATLLAGLGSAPSSPGSAPSGSDSPPVAPGAPAAGSASPGGAGAALAPLASGCVGVAGGIFVGFALAVGAVGLAGQSHVTGILFQAVVLVAGILALVWVIRAARAPASPLHAPVLFAFLVGGMVTMLGAFSLCSGIFLENPSVWERPTPRFTISPPIRSHLKGPAGQTH